MTFDPVQYKTTTRQQWDDAAEAWHRWGPTLETWLGEATEAMLDGAGVTGGRRCSTSRPVPAGRRWPPPAGSAPPAASSPTTSPPGS